VLLELSIVGTNYRDCLWTKEGLISGVLGLVPYTPSLYIILKLKLERNSF